MDSEEEFLDPLEAQRRAIAAMFAAPAESPEQAASEPSAHTADVTMEVIAVEASIAVDAQPTAAAAVAAPHESTTEAEESSGTDGEGAARPVSRRALSGMALLLQQRKPEGL
ncbi:hypothetical protein AAVH_32151 [Aphelenchoides avenae]|nr:hypothetical protein AAVH_32151 [Aphelenchus avenae]